MKKLINPEKFRITKYALFLLLIFLATLSIRLYLSFQTPDFSSEAYFNLREIENIKQTGAPFFYDSLSFGGRPITFMPLFHYIVAFFALFMDAWIAAKIIPNIMACTFIFIMYFIAKHITRNRDAAIFTAFVSAFIPIYFHKTLNNISEFSLVIPLLFLTFYFFLRINDDNKYIIYFVVSLFFLTLAHQTVIILILGLLIYLLFVKLEKLEESKVELEIILFSIFLSVWLTFLVFKQALLAHGPNVIWQNIPPEILSEYFKNINILEAVYLIGVIPFALGIYIIYKTIFQEKKRHIYVLMGFSMAVAALLWLKLIQLEIGLIYLGAVLTLLFSQYYVAFFSVVEKSHMSKAKNIFVALFILIFVLTSIYPSVSYGIQEIEKAPSQKEIESLKIITEESQPHEIIISIPEEGQLVSYVSGRKNMIDTNFILVADARHRYLDMNTIYTSPYSVEAIQLLNKYDIKYILLSPSSRRKFGMNDLKYAEKECFTPVYSDENIKIYKLLCRTQEGI